MDCISGGKTMADNGNMLYFGDNLDILREYVADESVDLVYLDPPFKSSRDYNVLFKDRSGKLSEGQIMAFEDTWMWDHAAERAYVEIVESKHTKVSQAVQAFRAYLGENDMMAYLSMMAIRLVELHRVLKPTGSIYLHCDPTASHYLKILMDAIFHPLNFRNEIIWKRAQPKSHTSIRMSRAHDVILFYAKSDHTPYKQQHMPHNPDYVEKFYKYVEPETGRRYRLDNLANPNKNRPNLTYEFPPGSGVIRVWRWTKERMQKAWEDGRVVLPGKAKVVAYKRYLDEMPGTPVTDIWDDIEHLHGSMQETLGYPTQKPEALLERIIVASSNEGDTVLDPFCGCGTTISVAERLNRRWIGIDITHLAIGLIKHRLLGQFEGKARYEVIGEPVSMGGAWELAQSDPYQFQWWALGQLGARPVEQKKGADKGIDGRLYFHDEGDDSASTKQIIFQVKAGKLKASYVRDLRGVLEREKGEIACLISIDEPTQKMRAEAAAAGFYVCPFNNEKYPRLQLLTIDEIFHGRGVEFPGGVAFNVTHKRASKAKRASRERQKGLL